MFALIRHAHERKVHALNGSGRAPGAASIDDLRAAGHYQMPQEGPYSVSIPGTVHGWETILAEHGAMPLSEVLKPAIRYAEEGFPVSDYIAYQWVGPGSEAVRPSRRQRDAAQRSPARPGRGDEAAHPGQNAEGRSRGWFRRLLPRGDRPEDCQLCPAAGWVDYHR